MPNNISPGRRFLIAALAGIALALLLYLVANSITRSNSNALEGLNSSDLPQLAKINQLSLSLFELQADLNILLIAARQHQDDEKNHLKGRQLLNRLNELKSNFNALRSSLLDPPENLESILVEISQVFFSYQNTVNRATEFSTIDSARSRDELIFAEKELVQLNNNLILVAEHFIQKTSSTSSKIMKSFSRNKWLINISFILLVTMILTAVILSRRMSRGLDDVGKALLDLSAGKLDTELPASVDIFLGDQQKALHDFKQSLLSNESHRAELENNLQRLQDSEKRYYGLLDLIATAIIVIDRNHEILLFNKAAETMFEYRENEVIGKNLNLLLPENFHAQHAQNIENFAQGKPNYLSTMMRSPVKALRQSGAEFFVEASLSKIILSSDFLMIAAVSDVSERIATERDLADYRSNLEEMVESQKLLTSELEYKNAELERFVYTVSHELRSPLISTRGFIGLLKKDLEANDHDRIAHDFEQIHQATDNMGELMEGLLELSRVGLVINPPQAGSLGELIHKAADQVREEIIEGRVKLDIDDNLPSYWGDQLRLVEVFQNLIENGIKFMGSQPEPLIEISAVEKGDEILCSVRDNGIGIDPQYHERIFNLFERLNQHIEGTGIGMSLVQRVIHAHGGKIWVESKGESHGSTFLFTLPVPKDPESKKSAEKTI